jgi:hypothetical protein
MDEEENEKKLKEYYGENILIETIKNKTVIEYKTSKIYIIEDVFDDELCNEIVKIINITKCTFTKIGRGNNVECYSFNDINLHNDLCYKDYYVFSTEKNEYDTLLEKSKLKKEITTNSLNGIKKPMMLHLLNKINGKFSLINCIISKKNPRIIFQKHSGLCFRKIYGRTNLHSDNDFVQKNNSSIINIKHYIRCATVIVALNDDYSGGIFEFPDHNVKIKMKKGSVLLFPPYWTHPHSVTSVENNTLRYTINTWLLKMIEYS